MSGGPGGEHGAPGIGRAATLRGTVDTRGVDIRLAPEADAPAEARKALAAAGFPRNLLGDAQLLVSELVTNSLRHGGLHSGQCIGVRARTTRRGLRLEVCDPGPGFPSPPPIPESSEPFGGRGLPIVDRLSARWGAGRTSRGRWQVWLELEPRAA